MAKYQQYYHDSYEIEISFRTIVTTAIEEAGGSRMSTSVFSIIWKWGNGTVVAEFFDSVIVFYLGDNNRYKPGPLKTLHTLYEADILDPDWSPVTLAKRINDGIARLKNDL